MPDAPAHSRLRRLLSWRWIGPIVVVAALLYAGPRQVFDVLRRTNWLFVLAAAAIAFPQAGIRGVRWRSIVRLFGLKLSLKRSVGMYPMGMVLAAVTPGRLGEFGKIFSLRRLGCNLPVAATCNVFDRLADVAFMLLSGLVGMAFFAGRFASYTPYVAAGLLVLVGAGALAIMHRRGLGRLFARFVPEHMRDGFVREWDLTLERVVRDGWPTAVQAFSLTVVGVCEHKSWHFYAAVRSVFQ
jgi:uncharacterized protein (TIRG00374 family)